MAVLFRNVVGCRTISPHGGYDGVDGVEHDECYDDVEYNKNYESVEY